MLLPYLSYLRVYERAAEAAPPAPAGGHGEPGVDTLATMTLRREQQTVLARSVAAPLRTPVGAELSGCYAFRREGVRYVCPVDLVVRSWLALASLGDEAGPAAERVFAGVGQVALDQEYTAWRTANPSAQAHIRQATWGVPRIWFLLVAQEERDSYVDDGVTSVRFRASIADARRRLLSAFTVLNAALDDEELLGELGELGRWLAGFDDECWVEVDYAGVAGLLGPDLDSDRSAYEVTTALRAIARNDFATAGQVYRQFEERWRRVAALERAS